MSRIPVIITTSDQYHHVLPIFFKQYNKYWGDPFELVGYKTPQYIPSNCTFVSLGEQRGPVFFSDDLRPYFEKQPPFFCWLMEDSFLRGFDRDGFNKLLSLIETNEHLKIGRIGLTNEGMNREHQVKGDMYYCDPKSIFRLSTQPSIWNRDFLLRYMKPNLSPWKFELQETDDDYIICGPVKNVVSCNEGVRKHDIYNLNLEGIE